MYLPLWVCLSQFIVLFHLKYKKQSQVVNFDKCEKMYKTPKSVHVKGIVLDEIILNLFEQSRAVIMDYLVIFQAEMPSFSH